MPLICVASPKGGVGKTTLTANLADALRQAGHRVVVIDLDPQNSLRLHFGMPLEDGGGFTAMLPRQPDWRAALRQTASGVWLLPHGALGMRAKLDLWAALQRDPELLAAPVRAMLAEPGLVVLADLPPGASPALAALTPLADLILAVLLADGASAALLPEVETGAFLGQGTLGSVLAPRLLLVLNQVDLDSRLGVAVVESAARGLGPRLIAAVCRDEAVEEALASQQTVLAAAPASRAAADMTEVAHAVEARLLRPSLIQPPPAPPPAHAFSPAAQHFAAPPLVAPQVMAPPSPAPQAAPPPAAPPQAAAPQAAPPPFSPAAVRGVAPAAPPAQMPGHLPPPWTTE